MLLWRLSSFNPIDFLGKGVAGGRKVRIVQIHSPPPCVSCLGKLNRCTLYFTSTLSFLLGLSITFFVLPLHLPRQNHSIFSIVSYIPHTLPNDSGY